MKIKHTSLDTFLYSDVSPDARILRRRDWGKWKRQSYSVVLSVINYFDFVMDLVFDWRQNALFIIPNKLLFTLL